MVASEQTPKARWTAKLEELFGLDLRSLALLRIGLALVILVDLFTRFQDLTAHYSDAGVLPRAVLTEELWKPGYWSLHIISGQPIVQAILFGVASLLALALLFGYKTRWVAIASWAMLISLHNRNPALIFAADDVLRAMMFWAMFLPLGAFYSIDSALNSSTRPLPKRVLSGATVALILQICFVYWFSAAFKTSSPIWWPEGSAVYYSLSFDQYVTPIGRILLGFPALMTFSTLVTLWLEWLGPLLLFIPFRTSLFRSIAVITFILLHIGFGLTLNIGIFPFLSITGWLALIPTEAWDRLFKRWYNSERAGLQIHYDADCGFCKKVVHFIRTFLLLPAGTPLLIAQDDPSIYADMQAMNSWVIVDWQGNRHFKFEAIAYVVSLSPIFGFLAPVLRWKPIMAVGTKFYETIASNRRAAGRFTKPFKFRPLEIRPSRTLNIVALLLLAYTFVWNLRSFKNLAPLFNRRAITSTDLIGRATRLDQSWSIFAPAPPRDDGWHVMPGKLKDGTEVDVFKDGAPIVWEKPSPKLRSSIYRNMQWRTYFINLNRAIGKKLFPYYGRYLCRDWNAQHQGSQQLDSVEIYFMDERTVPPGQPQTVKKELVGRESCASNPEDTQ